MKRTFAMLLIIVCLLTGCSVRDDVSPVNDYDLHESTLFAMDTVMELKVYGDKNLLNQAEDLIMELEGKLSVTDDGSEIYAINHNGLGYLSENSAELLSSALGLCDRTNGALDISIYPVVHSWGFTTGEYHIPDDSDIETLLNYVDYTNISFDERSRFVSLSNGMEIDLGSVAKGYTGNKVLELFSSCGVTSALLNLGGNVQALGSKLDGSPWIVAVQNPLGDGYLGSLEIINKSVITSGGYERYFEEDGKTYWHIIDPSTGYPADSGLISVSIVGEDGLICDGLSTALFVMGLDNAIDLWQKSNDFEAVFVSSSGDITITEGLEDSFTPLGEYEKAEVTVIRRG